MSKSRYIYVPCEAVGHSDLGLIWDTVEQVVVDVVRADVDRADWEREYNINA